MPNKSSDQTLSLADGFPPVDRERWLAEVTRVLSRGRGELDEAALARRFRAVLETETADGITLAPLYTAADAPPAGAEGLPGFAPFTRGATALRVADSWDVRQVVAVRGDGAAARGRAVEELERGSVSVELDLLQATTIDADLLDRVLGGVLLGAAPLGLWAGPRAPEAATALDTVAADRGVPTATLSGSLGFDPIGDHAQSGGIDSLPAAVAALIERVQGELAAGTNRRTVAIDVARYHAAGGSQVQALGLALATGVAYLRLLTEAGVPLAAAAAQLEFRVAASADQFPTIAALRALRTAWSRVGSVVGLPEAARAARIHAVPAWATITRHDPWVNLLRGTVSCFAAAVGGADIITVAPYDLLAADGGGELGRRMARNTQALLVDESGIGRVVDPAGGSFFVERLTAQIAERAWAWFQELEAAGGVVAALEGGLVNERLAATAATRREAIAHRRLPLTGVSEFPLLEEAVAPPGPPTAPAGGTAFPPLAPERYAAAFEQLRARSDAHLAVHGSRPAVFLATLGTPADHIARATFATNLFAAGGLQALEGGDLDTAADIGAAHRASGAPLACICSTDAVYAERAVAAATALRAAGARRIYLAGAPGAAEQELRAAGVDEFVQLGGDALGLLTRALAAAEVAP